MGGDVLYGGEGNDILKGGEDFSNRDKGENVLFGEAGNDTLIAAGGKDRLYGGTGDDVLYAMPDKTYKGKESGFHRFEGGEGRDKFIIGDANYVIEDFNPYQDSITMTPSLQPGTNIQAEQMGSNVLIMLESGNTTTVNYANVDDVTNSLGI